MTPLASPSRLPSAHVAALCAPALPGILTIVPLVLVLLAALLSGAQARAQQAASGPLEIDVSGANFAPLPIAVEPFAAGEPSIERLAADLTEVVQNDLAGSGLFRLVPRAAFVAQATDFNAVPNYQDWQVIDAQALVRGQVEQLGDGRLRVQFRVFDTVLGAQVAGLQLLAAPEDWRRVAHKVADGAYTALTGEGPYFDSRVVFIDESGPKDNRQKRLAIMDQDGANLRYLPGTQGLVLTPRFSPNDQTILFIAYDSGAPQVYLQNLDTGQRERLGLFDGMTFAPRFSPDGDKVVLSLARDGNTDLYAMTLANRGLTRLTSGPGIDTAPSFSPDGAQIVFESDRGGSQQLYVVPAGGGDARRISFGTGRYGTPVWSPRGDRIAFTKIVQGRFHIGVMRTDGTEERLLTTSFLDEGPTWSPNGRVIMFFRETPGATGRPKLMSVDITGRNLKAVATPNGASDPTWSPLRP
ncbi:MAG: Tol-Pal system beta propeller repeat protein TolB [Pseudomonadota bacterium]